MKVSDYIVGVLEKENVTDIFGVPGVGCGHFTDSLIRSSIRNHLTYHEQGAAFAACAYGQASGNIGVAYATAGPGATNLLTGVANAYVDSVPTLYIVGDKDLDTLKGDLKIRQKASQEVDIVEMARPVTKWSYQITEVRDVQYALEKAFYIARSGRPGPVLLDIPSSIQRMEYCEGQRFAPDGRKEFDVHSLTDIINSCSRPLFLVGGGVRQAGMMGQLKAVSSKANIPIVATVVCDDEFFDFENYIGFFGVDGDVCANQAIRDCDALICLGTRLNIKEVGTERTRFAQQARIIRIDIDQAELDYRLGDEEVIHADLKDVIPALLAEASALKEKEVWVKRDIKRNEKAASSNGAALELTCALAEQIPENVDITVGIGSHRRWFISGRVVKKGWRIFQSAGLASMGFALPAAIGVHFAAKRPVVCLDGDGGLMMNVQELQLLHRENLPITVVVFNNRCLGEIMEFQKKIFGGNYFATTEETGYLSADFEALAAAFKLAYRRVSSIDELKLLKADFSGPGLIEVVIPADNGEAGL